LHIVKTFDRKISQCFSMNCIKIILHGAKVS
jgi:hypothetical protein